MIPFERLKKIYITYTMNLMIATKIESILIRKLFLFVFFSSLFYRVDISRLEKSPLLANGYNPPPTHLNHMQFMQMNHHPSAMMSSGLPPHGLSRHDAQLMKNQPNIPNMDAIAR